MHPTMCHLPFTVCLLTKFVTGIVVVSWELLVAVGGAANEKVIKKHFAFATMERHLITQVCNLWLMAPPYSFIRHYLARTYKCVSYFSY